MEHRRVIGDILILLTAAFTVYLAVIMTQRIQSVVLRDDFAKIFRYELVICGVFLLFALDVRFSLLTLCKSTALQVAGWFLRMMVLLVVTVFVFFFGKICVSSLIVTDASAPHAIVLGLALENGKPAADLLSRLDTAQAYLQRHPRSVLILTGGNARKSWQTEAEVMHEILASRGVPEEKMRLEDQANTTKENFQNTARMIRTDAPVALISSNYHMDRAVQMARKAGFTQVQPIPAPSSPLHFCANVMYEVMLELNELTLRE